LQAAASVWARAGASVVLAGRKTDQLAKVEKETKALATDASAKIISVSVDITIVSEVQNLYTQIQKTFGRPADILINNAGSSGIAAPMGQIPWDDFTNVFGTHFLGTALMIKYFISTQQTPADPVGTIIYITSGLGSMLMPGFSAYAIAKLAGQRLTEYLDTEYPHLRAFTLSPGLIKTGLTHSSFEPFTKDHVELPGMMTLYLAQERANFLKGGFVGVNWDVKEIEANKGEIVEKKLLKMQWIAAKLGEGGHPFVT
jgi:NAD(P)-dependent dehydrogenase (short-subunit alcohol dehydrogenase family)